MNDWQAARRRAFGNRTWGSRLDDCVVVVDDSVEFVETTRSLLNDAGFRVATATDGMSGLTLIRRVKPRVVVLDLLMPHMSGYEVITAVRADAALQGVAIVVVTGMARDEAELHDMGRSADLCLTKPVDETRLVQFVRDRFASHATEPGLLKHIR